jgi:peptidoglycan/LPS O-acetylase OafA/YrhL
LIGDVNETTVLTAVFGVGACFYLFKDRIQYRVIYAVISAIIFLAAMFSPFLATPALAIFGGYLLFWFTFTVRANRLQLIGQRIDLSYGIYLYAFPIQKLLIMYNSALSPWAVTAITVMAASGIAWFSWWRVEKPALDLRGLNAMALPWSSKSRNRVLG